MCHLIWILLAAIIGFLIPFLFGNTKTLPVDIYYLIYFLLIGAFFVVYVRQTNFDYKKFFSVNLYMINWFKF